MIIQAIRTAIFYLLAFIVTFSLAAIIAVSTPFSSISRKVATNCASAWTKIMQFLLRFTVGIRTHVEGHENIPGGNYIVAAKHQSDWDTIALYSLFNFPSFIAKKQLFSIPLLGQTFRLMGTISVDRKRGAKAIPEMLEGTKRAVAAGRNILIFPEGTRGVPLAEPNFRSGASRVYEATNVPLLPVAVCSGFYWGRNSFVLWPGTARAKILPPIAPGLTAREAHKAMSTQIEKASIELALQAVDEGLSRPINDELRQRIQSAKSARAATNSAQD